jgi:phytoene dehydrogenase-like protein
MVSRYDAIVVGAGLGGLSMSTLLAKKGHKTLLLEKHNVPGGYATSFVRGRFEFEVALHELSDIGDEQRPGDLKKYLDYLGVSDKVEFARTSHLYRSIFPDLDINLPEGREEYIQTLIDVFPDQEKGIRKFMSRVYAVANELGHLSKLQHAKMPGALGQVAALPFKLRALPRYLLATWGDVLGRDVKDYRARAVISQYWGYFGLPPSQVSFFYFALALASYISRGASHIKGRSQDLSNAFIDTFCEYGGDYRLNCGVQKITVSGGRTTGVLTDDGEHIMADVVVSNASPITTCRDLIEQESIPSAYFKKLSSSTMSPSSFNVYMGVAKPLKHFGVEDHEIFINEDYDDEVAYDKFSELESPGYMAITCYNAVLPDISPPGTAEVVLTGLMYGEPWLTLPPEQYVDTKNRIADGMIDLAEKVLPGLRENTEVVEVSTPVTNMRYANNPSGSIYGFNNTPYNHTVLRPSARGPVDGLYFVGAWVRPGGGFSPSILSAQFAWPMISTKLR